MQVPAHGQDRGIRLQLVNSLCRFCLRLIGVRPRVIVDFDQKSSFPAGWHVQSWCACMLCMIAAKEMKRQEGEEEVHMR